jgi:hypothetical protein
MSARHANSPRRMQPLQAWLLAALLLAAQALGLAHGVAHGLGHGLAQGPVHISGVPDAGASQAGFDARADGHGHASQAAPAAGDASGHEAGSPDCRLIDQLAHADALCGTASLPPALPRAAVTGLAAHLPALPQGSAAAYLARGPPPSA